MWQQVAACEGEPAQLKRSLTAGKSPAGQTHMKKCMLFCRVEFVCVSMDVAGACHIGSVINEHGTLGQLEQAWGSWVIWRVVWCDLLAQLCQLRWEKCSCRMKVCAHTYMTTVAHVCTCFYRDELTRGSLSQIPERDRGNKQAWNRNDTSLKY